MTNQNQAQLVSGATQGMSDLEIRNFNIYYPILAKAVQQVAAQQHISDPNTMLAVLTAMIGQESGWNPGVTSSAGAQGIAQFMPATARSYGVNPSDPTSSLIGAARMMADLINHYQGDWAKAVAAYNAGQGAVDGAIAKADRNGGPLGMNLGPGGMFNWTAYLPKETINYINDVLPENAGGKTPMPSPKGSLLQLADSVLGPPRTGETTTTASTAKTYSPGQLPEPDLNDYLNSPQYQDDPAGAYSAYLKDYANWQSITRGQGGMDQSTKDYLTAAQQELARQISAGTLSVDAASKQFSDQLSAFTEAGNQFDKELGYGVPSGAQYIPGREPGGFYEKMGLSPETTQQAGVIPFNPFAAANALVSNSPNLNDIAGSYTSNSPLLQSTQSLIQSASPETRAVNMFESALNMLRQINNFGAGGGSSTPVNPNDQAAYTPGGQ